MLMSFLKYRETVILTAEFEPLMTLMGESIQTALKGNPRCLVELCTCVMFDLSLGDTSGHQ